MWTLDPHSKRVASRGWARVVPLAEGGELGPDQGLRHHVTGALLLQRPELALQELLLGRAHEGRVGARPAHYGGALPDVWLHKYLLPSLLVVVIGPS